MRVGRRVLLAGTASLAAPRAFAQAPALRIVAPFPPGGSVDLVARIVQPKLAELLGGAVVVENRTGAGGMLGAEQVARSAPDGSTVVWGNIATHALNAAVYTRMPYDPVADFSPVTLAAQVEFMLAVHRAVPARSVAELVSLARAEPGKLNYGTAGAGSLPHLLTEMLKRAGGGLQIEHVPYRGGGPMLVDLQAGHISMTIADVANILPLLQAGRLRGIAVAGAERSAVLPDLPTIAETLPGVVGTAWHGIFAPARTPGDVVKRINAAFVGAIRDADVQQRMRAAGTVPVGSSPEELASFQRAEIAKWTEIARAVGAKVE
jgi:tripartite-type tricarboxylate transporter receptor subunit TctC